MMRVLPSERFLPKSRSSEPLPDVIVQRPLATVGLALALGFLIGATWRR